MIESEHPKLEPSKRELEIDQTTLKEFAADLLSGVENEDERHEQIQDIIEALQIKPIPLINQIHEDLEFCSLALNFLVSLQEVRETQGGQLFHRNQPEDIARGFFTLCYDNICQAIESHEECEQFIAGNLNGFNGIWQAIRQEIIFLASLRKVYKTDSYLDELNQILKPIVMDLGALFDDEFLKSNPYFPEFENALQRFFDDPKLDEESKMLLDEIINLLARAFLDIQEEGEQYDVCGLFAGEGGGIGKVTVTILTPDEKRPRVERSQRSLYWVEGTEDYLGNNVIPALEATIQRVAPDESEDTQNCRYRIAIRGTPIKEVNPTSNVIEGQSLGLVIALGAYAKVTGLSTKGLAATGEVGADLSINSVGSISDKMQNILTYREKASKYNQNHPTMEQIDTIERLYVSTLEGNQSNYYEVLSVLPSGCDLKVNQNIWDEPISKIKTLGDLLQPGVLSDAFTEYLQKLSKFNEDEVSSDDRLYRTEDLKFYQNIAAKSSETVNQQMFPIPYGSNPVPVAKYLAKLFAEKRSKALESEQPREEDGNVPPVPVYIAASALQGKSLEAAIIESVEEVEPNIFHQAVRNALKTKDRLILILYGFDKDEGDLIKQLRKGNRDGWYRLILIARDIHQLMAWNKEYLQQPQNGRIMMEIYNSEKLPSPWLYWRYTFLRQHINELLKDKNRLIYTRFKNITLEEFFFPLADMPSPYIPLRIQDISSSEYSQDISLVELLKKKGGPRFVFLLADGGAGKTTMLLKTALDCVHQKGDLKECRFVPAFIDLSRLGPAINSFYNLIAAQMAGGSSFSADDLKYTDNALLIFDGLNEILSSVRIDELRVAFNNFIDTLPSSSRVIVAGRRDNWPDQLDGKERFQRFTVQAITEEDIRSYLEKVLRSKNAKKMCQALGNQMGLLKNPMLLQLFSMISPKQVGSELNRALIYRYAIQNWIEEQSKRGIFPHFVSRGRKFMPRIYQLLQRLAVKMVKLGKSQLSEEEAIDVIASCQKENWYPKDSSGKPVDAGTIYEELFNSGLLRLVC